MVRAALTAAAEAQGQLAMCCFSNDVQEVSSTSIFARHDGSNQLLVYQMRIRAAGPVAMVLPLPVDPAVAPDAAIEWLDLSDHENFFDELAALFVVQTRSKYAAGRGDEDEVLEVVQVGSYEASYVPSRADFQRLDERFRLPEQVWGELGELHDYGFAVFQLRGGEQKVHPMAFRFRTRARRAVFFPTLHVHHGSVPPVAAFDHALYLQAEDRSDGIRAEADFDDDTDPDQVSPFVGFAEGFVPPGWMSSVAFGQMPRGPLLRSGLVDGNRGVARKKLNGPLLNQDTWVRI